MSAGSDVTQILRRWSEGDPDAFDELAPIVYDELKRLAHARLRNERLDHTLNTTGLVHEACLRLIDIKHVQWSDRNHFLAMASRVMRRILVDYALKRKAQKRGGGASSDELEEEHLLIPDQYADMLLELDDALGRMEARHPRQSQAMELYYFGGFTQKEVGEVLGLSQPTVVEDLRFARAWLASVWNE